MKKTEYIDNIINIINAHSIKTCSNRINANNCHSCHSELNIIREMNNSTKFKTDNNRKVKKRYNIFVYRVDNFNNFVNSKPCISCSTLISNCNFIKNVYFINSNNQIEKIHSNKITNNVKMSRQQRINNNMVITRTISKRYNFLSNN